MSKETSTYKTILQLLSVIRLLEETEMSEWHFHTRAQSRGGRLRTHVCTRAAWFRTHTCVLQLRDTGKLCKTRGRDSNPVYCSPFAVAFPTYFHFLTFPTTPRTGRDGTGRGRERRDDTRQKTAKSKSGREARRELRDHEKSRNIATPFISSQESGKRRIFGFSKMFHHNSHCFRHKNARTACSPNDDVSNFALYILTDVTLPS